MWNESFDLFAAAGKAMTLIVSVMDKDKAASTEIIGRQGDTRILLPLLIPHRNVAIYADNEQRYTN